MRRALLALWAVCAWQPFMSRALVYLVTGATDGIGEFTALQLARQQHTVLVHGRSEGKVKSVVARLRKHGGEVHGASAAEERATIDL